MQLQKSFLQYTLLIILIICGVTGKSMAQTYEEARNLAVSGERAKARQICKAILQKEFNPDAALLLARTYAWDGLADSTRLILNDVLKRLPGHFEALDAYADVEYWSGNYATAIDYCNQALEKEPRAEAILLKKAKILHSDRQFQEAVTTLEMLIRLNPAHSEAMQKLVEFRPDVLKNTIRVNYVLDYFDQAFNRKPWQLGSLSYGRKTSAGTFIARANLASRYTRSGFQGEIDAFPRINANNYGYLNYGFSQSTVFPKHRVGAEWYHNFPKSFEASAGARLLYFNKTPVDIYTVTVGKYLGNYWLSARAFITPDTTVTAVSGQLQMRRYFADPESYLGIRLGYGVSPDDNRNLVDSELASRLNLKTRSVRVEFNHRIKQVWIFNIAAVWGNEQLQTREYSGFYTFDISMSRLF
jgi:YaiO family outer membrane protein